MTPISSYSLEHDGTYVIHLWQILEEPLKVSLFADRVE